MFNIFAALAQFEAELIRERTRAGLAAARARGRNGGRKPVSGSDPKVKMAKRMNEDRSSEPQGDMCESQDFKGDILQVFVLVTAVLGIPCKSSRF